MMIVSFSEDESKALEKVYSTLTAEGFQEIVVENSSQLYFRELQINLREQSIYIGQQKIDLKHYEFSVFAYLAHHPNWVFSKEQIYEAVWKEPGDLCGSAVANTISQIRRKLREGGAEKGYIQTIVNSGYKFIG